ncbi:MAG: anthranilate synthase component I [Nitrospirota bacterium]|jgi:anthranilate synthase component 1
MLYPDFGEFTRLSGQGNLVPLVREMLSDLDTPVSAFLKLDEKPSFLLESVEGGEKWARYSFIGFRPHKVIRSWGRHVEISGESGTEAFDVDDPIELFRGLMSQYRPVTVPGLPRFSGGLVGYLGYDMVRFIEDLPGNNVRGLDVPDSFLMLTDTMLIFDNLKQTIKVLTNVHLDGRSPEEAYGQAAEKLEDIVSRLRRPVAVPPRRSRPEGRGGHDFLSSFGSREDFERAVLRVKEYIHAGDIFQAVLSQRFERPTDVAPFDIYRALRVVNPSPYMYFIDTGDVHVVGSSPEILIRLEDGKVTLRPIAGTRRRGLTEEEDRALEAELKADPKEVAEHIMLVDLGRNDVGRVSEIGSVRVTDLMSIERYSHVMHMVSNVQGSLSPGLDAFDVLRASFPAGTVTGAPKIRAMEIIDELEPTRRGPYAGSVGYFSYSGNMDTCITIRTLLVKNGKAHVQAGAGVVSDSLPDREYTETVNKAMGMMKAVDMAEAGLE